MKDRLTPDFMFAHYWEITPAFLREQGMPTEINHRDLILEQARWNTPVEEGEA